jgi:hypothetical protein
MTTFLMTLSFIVGAWLGWRYENILNDFIESIKARLNK